MKSIFSYLIGRLSSFPMPNKLKDILMWPIATRILGRDYRARIKMRDGFYMWGFMSDILSRKILFHGKFEKNLWEPATCFYLEKYSKNAQNILIAGAHIGYLVLKSAAATKGVVHAFEPVGKLFDQTDLNIKLNPYLDKKIILNKKALGENKGSLKMYVEDIRSSAFQYSGGHTNQNTTEVPVTTIDEYAKENSVRKIDLILLDVEGFEWYALEGAKKILEYKPTLILEISPKVLKHTQITPEMMFKKVLDMGYKIYFIDDYSKKANLVSYSEETKSKFLKTDYVNILATKNEE